MTRFWLWLLGRLARRFPDEAIAYGLLESDGRIITISFYDDDADLIAQWPGPVGTD